MRFVSTEGATPPTPLSEALFRSLAPDGGLYVPEEIRPMDRAQLEGLRGAHTQAIASAVLGHLLAGSLPAATIDEIARSAIDFPIPLTRVDARIWQLELFHGPTLAFKDVGARTMARLMTVLQDDSDTTVLTVLVATSGDTGSAVASAFAGLPGTRIVVLFPDGQVSPLQERQFSTLGGNVHALAVQGTFDDCQRLAKTAFADRELVERLRLTSANSINVGRLLPQVVYHVGAWAQLDDDAASRPLVVSVPSGNFGNLTAGLIAQRLGVPVDLFVAACNINDVVPEFLRTGTYAPRSSVRTLSNAMDVGAPSNLARIRWMFDDDMQAIGEQIVATVTDDAATRATIASVFDRTGVTLDPHTAVGYAGLTETLAGDELTEATGIVLATAHPAKFRETVEPLIGREIPLPERLAVCLQRERKVRPLEPSVEALREALLGSSGPA